MEKGWIGLCDDEGNEKEESRNGYEKVSAA